MSYNVKLFDYFDYADKINQKNAPKIVDYIVSQQADIKVFQEYFDTGKDVFVATQRLKKAGCLYHVLANAGVVNGSFSGLAIFSKYPIIKRKDQTFGGGQNGYLVADVVKNQDTIRVINVHFYSMGIRINRLKGQGYTGVKMEGKGIYRQLKHGFTERFKEVDIVEKLVKQSPYPVVLCGDFNETPYSYSYGKMAKHLSNAFETGGKGFGFTYNQSPKYIRIDNQFFDANYFQVVDFKIGKLKYSDHYPLFVTYGIQQP